MVSHDSGRLPQYTAGRTSDHGYSTEGRCRSLAHSHAADATSTAWTMHHVYGRRMGIWGGDGMDAPFHPYSDTSSHKGGSILFFKTDLRRIQTNLNSQEEQSTKDIGHVAIKIDHSEVVGRSPNPQELLALLGALAVSARLTTPHLTDKCIGSDCKSLVDYINVYRHARMRNEVGKLPFLLAIQQYLQRDAAQQVRWV